jgi:hypothetical protein
MEEATAFICASILQYPEIVSKSVVITNTTGYRFVEKNPSIKIVIFSQHDFAQNINLQSSILHIIPTVSGNINKDNNIHKIPRQLPDTFRNALTIIGVEESDADRLTKLTGRSEKKP